MKQKEWKKQRRFRQGFARLLQKMLHKPLLSPPYSVPLQSIAILAQEKYGDAILLTPLLRQLRIHFPKTEIHVITFSRATHDFFRSDPNIDALHFAKNNALTYYRRILSQRFDLLFNTKDHPSTSFLLQSLIIRARRKAGIDSPHHRGIYDYLVDLDFHTQVALKNCGLLSILGKPAEPERCRPYIPPMPVSSIVTDFIETIKERSIIGINISAGQPNRYWTEKNWKVLVDAFPDKRFLVLATPQDLNKKIQLEESCPNVVPSPQTRNLYEASLITEKTAILITPDTAMVHVASCSGTPVLGLYGKAPQDQSRFKPFMVQNRLVISETCEVKDIAAAAGIEALRILLNP